MSQSRTGSDYLDAVSSTTQGRGLEMQGPVCLLAWGLVRLECLPPSSSFLEPSRIGVWYLLEREPMVGDLWGSRYRLDQQMLCSSQMMERQTDRQQIS